MRRLNCLSPAAMHPTPGGRSRSRRAPLSLTPADLVRSERSQGRAPGRERRIWPEISEARARLFADDRATAKPAPTLTPVAEHEDSGWQGKRADTRSPHHPRPATHLHQGTTPRESPDGIARGSWPQNTRTRRANRSLKALFTGIPHVFHTDCLGNRGNVVCVGRCP